MMNFLSSYSENSAAINHVARLSMVPNFIHMAQQEITLLIIFDILESHSSFAP
jgi:hypothetical protein